MMVEGSDASMKLNGWQRLWVFVAALWMLVVLLFSYELWPSATQVSKSQIYDKMSSEDARRLDDYYTVLAAKYGGTVVESPLHVVGPTVNVDGYPLEFSEGASPEDIKRTTQAFHNGLRRVLATTRGSFAGAAVASWLVLVMALYALGWGVAWVRRGFHHASET
jgi:hypothetical protein